MSQILLKIKGKYKNDCPSSFWVKGTPEEPKIGNIYNKKEDATSFSESEADHIVETFGHMYDFEKIPE